MEKTQPKSDVNPIELRVYQTNVPYTLTIKHENGTTSEYTGVIPELNNLNTQISISFPDYINNTSVFATNPPRMVSISIENILVNEPDIEINDLLSSRSRVKFNDLTFLKQYNPNIPFTISGINIVNDIPMLCISASYTTINSIK